MKYIKSIAAVMIAVFSFQCISAQSNYVMHTLKQGESLSTIAKEYNTSVGDIMRINGMHADSKLVYGSQIKIPSAKKQSAVAVKSNTFINTPTPSPPSSGEITHIVAKGETLYSISKKYNVTVSQIKSWNNLTDESAKLGTLLIVNESGVNKLAKTPVQKPQPETAVATIPAKEPVVENKPDVTTTTVTDNVNDNVVKPAAQAENNTITSVSSPVTNHDTTAYSGEGFFASQFEKKKSRSMQNMSGISKTFKTASGWADGKYYILANDIEPGTIVKITADNGSNVYAKVLWSMGDMKENTGLNFRISNATAAALHENNDSFNLSVNF